MEHDVYVGKIVHWYMDLGCEPAAAIVTSVGSNSIGVSVFGPNFTSCLCHDGVLHVSDEGVRKCIENGSGAWDYARSKQPQQRGPGRPRKELKQEASTA
jgi:hypothetical protein